MKVKRKLNGKKIILLVVTLLLITTLIISLIHIFNWFSDNKNIDKEVEVIQTKVEVNEVEDNDNTQIISQPEVIEEKKEEYEFNPYWDYIGMKLINVEFSDLKQENSDVVGWVQVNGTTINYPFVQTTDNDYYLTHSFYKKNNGAGWVFMDYRNNLNELDKNTLIYGHARLNNTMFGSLRNALKDSWINDTNNHVVKLSTQKYNTLWQVFSVYRIPTTSDYIQTSFKDDNEFMSLIEKVKGRSAHNFNTSVGATDHILTLSTCYSSTERVVLHAKLIKRAPR